MPRLQELPLLRALRKRRRDMWRLQTVILKSARRVKYWEIIHCNLKKRGWSLGYVSALDSQGRTIWIVDAHRGDGKRFVVRADELLTAFMELESAIRSH
jgi:hypothetical protein